ncbi:hypothetical protein FRC14_002304 [Serendipita sp. 396]|nr:hypothetical protein FRC14_002304 [Serendipita sp. 396]KAG8834207.1 hypothetical protein FRC18_002363 [Serendipita sp. 400]
MLSVLKTAGFRIPTIGIPRASDPALHLSALRLSALRQLSGAARSAQSARPAWPGSGLSRSLSVKHSKFGVVPRSPSSPLTILCLSALRKKANHRSLHTLCLPPPPPLFLPDLLPLPASLPNLGHRHPHQPPLVLEATPQILVSFQLWAEGLPHDRTSRLNKELPMHNFVICSTTYGTRQINS